jgi:hypothetical protein
MKKQYFLLLIVLILFSNITLCQSNTVASGGNGSGSGGTVSFSIGQIDYVSTTGSTGSINQGQQQPYELFLTSGIEEYQQLINISIGPNPTVDKLNIHLNEQIEGLYCKLIDINGKEIIIKHKLNQHAQIDLSAYPVGTYLLSIIKQDRIIQSYKILKK